MKRLSPTKETINFLLLRCGNRCAFPDCSHAIFNDENILIAQCCHIEAALPGGPRFNHSQSEDDRRSAANLVFLCHKHHKETDDEARFSVATLKKIKADHEAKFSEQTVFVGANYAEQVLENLYDITNTITNISDTVEQIKNDQQTVIDLLLSSVKPKPAPAIEPTYFGAPKTIGFRGRVAELEELNELVNQLNTVILGGISGIGKTSLVVKFASNRTDYKTIWINSNLISSENDLHKHFANFFDQEFQDHNIKRAIEVFESDQIIYTIAQCLNTYKSLVLLDNFHPNQKFLVSFVGQLNSSIEHSKVIVLTNQVFDTHLWINPVGELVLKGLDIDAFTEVTKAYFTSIDDSEIHEFFFLLNGHPYLLKLCSSMARYLPISIILIRLRECAADDVVQYINSTVLSKLDGECRSLLVALSTYGLPFRFSIGEFVEAQNFEEKFKELKTNYLVEQSSGYPLYSIHDLIKQFIEPQRSVDKSRNFLQYLISINDDRYYFESNKLVNLSFELREFDIAKKVTVEYLNGMMGSGEFNRALHFLNQVLKHDVARSWPMLYYVRGRAYRFQDNIHEALGQYECGLLHTVNTEEVEMFKFEKASMLAHLSWQEGVLDYELQAKAIYAEIASNGTTFSRKIQGEIALASIDIRNNLSKEVIARLNILSSDDKFSGVNSNVKASFYQILGDAYSKNREYKMAFNSFDLSCDEYKDALIESGLNVIDGLYHLYQSYGYTYAALENFEAATEMFGICHELGIKFSLEEKVQHALFDLGYHLILKKDYKRAADALTLYLDNKSHELTADMPLVFRCLTMSHWYSNDFLNAIHLMGLYINACEQAGHYPIISIAEGKDAAENPPINDFFRKGMLLLIIPKEYSITDFHNWVSKVLQAIPSLTDALQNFAHFQPGEDNERS